MRRFLWGTLVLVALAIGFFPAAEPDKSKEAARLTEVEARFHDGSTVRLLFLQENLEVVTRFGKLTVPVEQIRSIDFGFRLPESVEKKVNDAIKHLSSDNFNERETATKDLVTLGAQAYPALLAATKGADLDTTRRLETVLTQIREKVPADKLRTRVNDLVVTTEFTIAGRIANSNIKVRTKLFGDQELKTADFRSLRSLKTGGQTEFTVDAEKHGGQDRQWLDTGHAIGAGSAVTITASGQVDLWPMQPGGYLSGPAGSMYKLANSPHSSGTLLGRIGKEGKPFVIGERYRGAPGEEGTLYLNIVPSPWNNPSSGSYKVSIAPGD